jgi:hypothetical protein
VALLTRVFAEELVDLAHRADLQSQWAASGRRIRAVVDPLARAVTAALNGADARTELSAANSALDALHVEDPSGFGSVSRRPLRRIAETLEQLSVTQSGSSASSAS